MLKRDSSRGGISPSRGTGSPPGVVGSLWKQVRYRWAMNLLMAVSLVALVGLYTYARNSSAFQHRSIQLIMKDMGHNLWFIDVAGTEFQASTGAIDLPRFPDDRVRALIEDRGIASTYWGNVLQAPFTVNGREVLLTGLEVLDDHQVTDEKAHLLNAINPGSVALGHTLARAWNVRAGEAVSFGDGRTYLVQEVFPPRGALDDERLWVPLNDAQELLDAPGEVNLILGFLCMGGRSLDEGLKRLDRQVAERHSSLRVVPQMNVLNARTLARMTTSNFLNFMLISIAATTGLLVTVLGWMEINDRRYELAVMLAMGAGYPFLVFFFLAKLAVLGLAGSLAGFLAGSYASIHWLSQVLVTHTQPVSVLWSDLPGIVGLTLLLVGMASIAPLIRLTRLDPTRVLAEA